jgi:hypothetical protein
VIRVTDVTGMVHEYEDGDFHTEDVGNNLVVEANGAFAVFAEGQWVKAEKGLF